MIVRKFKNIGRAIRLLFNFNSQISKILLETYVLFNKAKKSRVSSYAGEFEHLEKIMEKFSKKVQLVFLDFPLQGSRGVSHTVAVGGVCADKQDKFWEYHALAFNGQKSLNSKSPNKFAEQLKLDLKKFESCMKDKSSTEKVELARKEGERIGVQGTPAIYINGRKVMGGIDVKSLERAIKRLL